MPEGYEWVFYYVIPGLVVAAIIALWKRIAPPACKWVCDKCGRLLRPAGGVVRRYGRADEVEEDLLAAIKKAQRTLVFVGVSHRTHLGGPDKQSRFLAALDQAVRKKVSIRFYFADPDGDELRKRALNVGLPGGCHWSDDIRTSWTRLRSWASGKGSTLDLEMHAYPAAPLLRYCLIDEKLAFVSYYHPWRDPDGVHTYKSTEPPIYLIERGRLPRDPLLDFFTHAHRLLGECREITEQNEATTNASELASSA